MASKVRFLQCSGCRFDSPFWDGPDTWIPYRNQDLWKTFEAVLSLCQSENIDLLFLMGNLFEQEYTRKPTVERVANSLGSLTKTRVFIVPGEKDPLVISSPYRLTVWPNNVHIFSSGINNINLQNKVTVYGSGWTAFQQNKSFLSKGFRADVDTTSIMLLHSEVGNDEKSNFLTLEQIGASELTYLALGHQENYSGIQKTGRTFWADSGVIETRSFTSSGPHGVIIGEIEEGSIRLEFRELGQRQYISKSFDLPSDIQSLETKLLAETSSEERQRNLYRVTFSKSLPEEDLDFNSLQKILSEKFRYIQVIDPQEETHSPLELDHSRPVRAIHEECDFMTLSQVYLQKISDYQLAATSSEDQKQWELVKKSVWQHWSRGG